MRQYRLTNQERAATGFTDVYAIDHKDLTEGDTSQNIVLETLPNNKSILYKDAMMVVTEAFTGGGNTAVTVQVGHAELNNDNTADPNFFILDSSVFTKDKFYGAASATATGEAVPITASTPLDITVTTTGGTNATVDTGQLLIYFKIIRDTDVLDGQG
jgi:hypothetical protein